MNMQDNLTDPKNEIPIIEMKGICKRFPGVLANDRIDLKIYRLQIHALLGENGAGKSTLMKILYGFYRMDEGSILFNGKEVQIKSPADARDLNIGMVFQVLNLIPAMSVLENIALFLKNLPGVYKPADLKSKINTFSKLYGLEVNPDAMVSHLSIGEQQKVEILKLLLSDAKVLILDEPSRVLAPHEIEGLYSVLQRLRNDGYAIVLIAHKLREVLSCADVITILRAGKIAGEISKQDATEEKLIRMMFDKQLSVQIERKQIEKPVLPGLELSAVCTRSDGSAVSLRDIDLKVFPGEIVGVAGVSGNGQRELCDVILGMEKIVSGKKYLEGKNYSNASARVMRDFGTGFIPENPLTMATVPFMSVLENMAISRSGHYSLRGGLGMDWEKVRQDTQSSLEKFGFTFTYYAPAKALSGGNLQRLIIAREMLEQPKLIIASYLTRGLDVQSALVARQELMQARNSGAGVLLVSEDLEELFSLSDRMIVLFEGGIVGEFKPAETNYYQIGYLMTGSKEVQDVKN